MKKAIFYQWAFYLLLAGNAITIYFLLSHGHRPEPKWEIIDRLGFDEQQVNQYEQEIQKHRTQIKELESKQRELKHRLFRKIDQEPDSSSLAALTQAYRDIQMVHYRHFAAIRSLCKPDQLPAFEQLEIDLPKLFAPHHPPKK
ncbi:MAG: hypothetical protein ACOVO3_07105 [Fluviicola sp.]|jgi:hypothetical protein